MWRVRLTDESQVYSTPDHHFVETPKRVGIVGGGIAGLYTAFLLKQKGIDLHILEGTHRVGGRVKTHFFDSIHKDQYFEAGAMRIPEVRTLL